MSSSHHGNHGHELQDGNISTSINGKSNDGKTTKLVRASINGDNKDARELPRASTTRVMMSWSQHGNHGQDGNISTSINGKSNDGKKAKSVQASMATTMMLESYHEH